MAVDASTRVTNSGMRRTYRWLRFVLLLFASLYYLQFGLQALVHFLPQGILALVGAISLGWGAVRTLRSKPAALLVLIGTSPILILHAVLTLMDPGELPFLIGSIPAPLIALIATIRSRSG